MSEQDFLERFSPENLIRRATQPLESLRLPAEYASAIPDMLGMATDKLLGYMGMGRGGTNREAAPQPYVPVPGKDGAPSGPVGIHDVMNMIKRRESSNNYTALNRESRGNTASGAYQYTDSTWNGFGGYAKAMLAPPAVQDARFQQDIQDRYHRFGGDPFKVIAAHYLPAAAGNPAAWTQPYKLPSGKVVKPVASYIAYVIKGTPLEAQFNDYLARQ